MSTTNTTNDKKKIHTHVGSLLKNSSDFHDNEPKAMFNIQEISFFQKCVSKGLIDKGVRIRAEDYLKSLVFLDYFTKVLDSDYKVCDNLVVISKAMHSDSKAANGGVDPKNSMGDDMSSLGLDLVIMEIGLYAQGRGDDYYTNSSSYIKQRYNKYSDIVDFKSSSIRTPEPYYDALGQMLTDFVSISNQPLLEHINSRADFGAIVFTDNIIPMLTSNTFKQEINKS